MQVTINTIRRLAVELRMSYGELIRLARECEENANLPSLAHMTALGREQLFAAMLQVQEEKFYVIAR
jgi:hypothetical protein